MSRQAMPRKLTYDDYVDFPDDGLQHELIDGEHFMTPAPTVDHQAIASTLGVSLGAHVMDAGIGQVLFAPLDLLLSPHDVVQPDFLFLSADQLSIAVSAKAKYLTSLPDLVVEVLSPSTRRKDLHLKRSLYERAGVPEYRIVDPERTSVTIYRRANPSDPDFAPGIELSAELGDVLSTSLIRGWEFPLPISSATLRQGEEEKQHFAAAPPRTMNPMSRQTTPRKLTYEDYVGFPTTACNTRSSTASTHDAGADASTSVHRIATRKIADGARTIGGCWRGSLRAVGRRTFAARRGAA